MPATLVGAIAAATMSGCASKPPTQTRDCVDKDGRVLADSACEESERRGHRSGMGYPYFVYGGIFNRARGIVSGGSRVASPDANIVTRGGTVLRGGFGSSGSGRGGGISFGG